METAQYDQQNIPAQAVGLTIALIAFGVYLSTLAPTVLDADSGEFQFVAWLPGIAHPTGYPLYVLLGWFWTHLFRIGEVAWRMNLLSAIFAAGAVGFTFGAARQLLTAVWPDLPGNVRLVAAAATALTFAVTPTFWSQAIVAEVYPLHALFVAVILWLTLKIRREGKDLSTGTAKLLTFLIGLSLTHHRTIVLILPALLIYLFPLIRRTLDESPHRTDAKPKWVRLVSIHSLLLFAPLLLYLYLPIVAPTTPYTTLLLSKQQTLTLYNNTLPGFWDHIMGAVFTGELRPTAADFDRVTLTWQLLRQQFGWVGLLLALMGLFTLILRQRNDILWFTGLTGGAFVAFNLIYFIGDIFVLFIPVWLIVALWIGVGTLGLAHWLADSFIKRKSGAGETPVVGLMAKRLAARIYKVITVGLVSLLFLLPVILFITWRPEVSQAQNLEAQQRWRKILAEDIPSNAVLLTNDRNEMMSLWYYQYVEQRRPDLLGLFPLIAPGPEYRNVGRVLDQALDSGRPVYLIKPMPGLDLKADLTASGSLYQAIRPEAPPMYSLNLTLPDITIQSVSNIPHTESILLLGYDLTPANPKAGEPLTVRLHWQTTQPLSIDYTTFVHLIDEAGQRVGQNDHRPGGVFYPSSYWQPGEILHDGHDLTVPADALPGVYQLRAGMYYQPQPGVIAGMGGGEIIGQFTMKTKSAP